MFVLFTTLKNLVFYSVVIVVKTETEAHGNRAVAVKEFPLR